MNSIQRAATFAIALGSAPLTATAQDVGAQRTVRDIARERCASFARPGIPSVAGLVRESDGSPIPFATIRFEGFATAAVSERSGCFLLRVPARAALQLDVRRVGFRPFSRTLGVRDDSTLFLDVELVPIARVVNGVTVVAARDEGMEATGFYDRMLERSKGVGDGYFMTPEDVELRGATQVTSLVLGVPGVDVRYNPSTRDGIILGHSYTRSTGEACRAGGCGGTPENRCVMNLFLDGVHIPDNQSVDALTGVARAIDAVEVYPTATQAPPQFQPTNGDAACGSVVMWTKRPTLDRRPGSWLRQNMLLVVAVPLVAAVFLSSLLHR